MAATGWLKWSDVCWPCRLILFRVLCRVGEQALSARVEGNESDIGLGDSSVELLWNHFAC